MKIKFNSDDDLPLMLKLYNKMIVAWAVFYEDNKYCPQDFTGECFINHNVTV